LIPVSELAVVPNREEGMVQLLIEMLMANQYPNRDESRRPIRGKSSSTYAYAAGGAGFGAVLGALVLGPVGAMIGGALGGGIGGALGAEDDDSNGR
jgi:hypothetical protein